MALESKRHESDKEDVYARSWTESRARSPAGIRRWRICGISMEHWTAFTTCTRAHCTALGYSSIKCIFLHSSSSTLRYRPQVPARTLHATKRPCILSRPFYMCISPTLCILPSQSSLPHIAKQIIVISIKPTTRLRWRSRLVARRGQRASMSPLPKIFVCAYSWSRLAATTESIAAC